MERSRNRTLMNLNSQDFENLESVEELYFGERETEDNQERASTFRIKILWSVTLLAESLRSFLDTRLI